MPVNWISIKQIRIPSVFIASTIITLAIPMFVVFHSQRKLNFVVASICSIENTTRTIFFVCAVFSSILSAVCATQRLRYQSFTCIRRVQRWKVIRLRFFPVVFLYLFFSSLNLKRLYGWVSCPYLVLWKKNLFLYSSDARLLVLFVQMIWTLVPFFCPCYRSSFGHNLNFFSSVTFSYARCFSRNSFMIFVEERKKKSFQFLFHSHGFFLRQQSISLLWLSSHKFPFCFCSSPRWWSNKLQKKKNHVDLVKSWWQKKMTKNE